MDLKRLNSDNPTVSANTHSTSDHHRLKKGTWVGDCEVLDFLGEGGMGEVYKVRHKYLNKILALKLLPSAEGKAAERFRNEARALASLRHENIVSIYDFFIDENLGLPCLTMEFIQGKSLVDVVTQTGPMTESRVVNIFIQIFEALSYAHERRIVHRDVKPSNLILSLDSRGNEKVHILDFGIAKFLSQAANPANSITQTGEIVGSPIYMSPEQCNGEKVTELSDLYSAGCCLFYCLTGKPPLKGANALATIAAKLEGKTESLYSLKDQLQLSSHLASFTDELIKPIPADRIVSAAEALRILRKGSSFEVSNVKKEHHNLGTSRKTMMLIASAIPLLALVAIALNFKWKGSPAVTDRQESVKLLNVYTDPNSGSLCMEFSPVLAGQKELGTIGYFSKAEGKTVTRPLKGVFSIPASSPADLGLFKGIDEHAEILEELPSSMIHTVSISGDVTTHKSLLPKLRRFSHLNSISLKGGNVKDESLDALETLPGIITLNIVDTSINPDLFGRGNLIKRLKTLRIEGKYPVVRLFQVSGVCPRLTELTLHDTEIRKSDLSLLTNIPNLVSLNLEYENLAELSLSQLSRYRKLQKLDITGSVISDKEIAELAKLKNLKQLVSQDSLMTSTQLEALQRALPDTKVKINIIDISKRSGKGGP